MTNTRAGLALANSSHSESVHAHASLIMARGVASPAPASLPKVSFIKVVGENSTTRTGVHDNQQRSYGCVSMHSPLVRMLTGGQTMIFPYSRGRSTTFDTSVFLFPR